MVSVYYVEGKDMYIETKRLVLRELLEEEAEVLLEISNDKQVKKYHPAFFENSTLDFIKTAISYFQINAKIGVKNPEHEFLLAVCLKDTGEVVGVITLNSKKEPPKEWHIGWYFLSRYTGKGYASEAGAAASDYFLEYLSLDYISAGVRVDNPASFRTAQKSGFTLIEKRIPYNAYESCHINDFNAVAHYFSNIPCERANGNWFYFQKLNKNRSIEKNN